MRRDAADCRRAVLEWLGEQGLHVGLTRSGYAYLLAAQLAALLKDTHKIWLCDFYAK